MCIRDRFQKNHVIEINLWVIEGDFVSSFRGANDAIGTLVLKFDSESDLVYALNHQKEWMTVLVQ